MTEQQPTCRLQFATGSRVVATSRPADDLAVPAPKAKELIDEGVQANGAAAGGSTNLALSMAAVPFTDSVPLSGGQAWVTNSTSCCHRDRERPRRRTWQRPAHVRIARSGSASPRGPDRRSPSSPRQRNGVQAILALGRGLNSVPPLLHQIVLNELDRAPGTERRLERLRYHQNVPLTVLLAVIGNSYLSVRRVGADHQQRGATAEFDQRLRCSAHHGLKVHGIRRVC